jgi:molybdopterin synthase catalytic subunit
MDLITREPISAFQLIEERHPSCGGVVTFEGRVRNHHQGRSVEHLFYEAYVPMAEKVLQTLIEEIQREWPETLLRVRHRIGQLEIGEVAVAIVVWAPHRKEAFLACEAMIDRIKERVPIWKRETYGNGERAWVIGCQ